MVCSYGVMSWLWRYVFGMDVSYEIFGAIIEVYFLFLIKRGKEVKNMSKYRHVMCQVLLNINHPPISSNSKEISSDT